MKNVEQLLERYAPLVDRETGSDKRFFERHSDRRFRIRKAGRGERGTLAALDLMPDVEGIFVAVKCLQVRPSWRDRLFWWDRPHLDVDVDEETARRIYEILIGRAPGSEDRERA
ncbi:MAG: hypothetical protein ACLPKB_05875 [Xanthobacteraceae bacterium]